MMLVGFLSASLGLWSAYYVWQDHRLLMQHDLALRQVVGWINYQHEHATGLAK